MCDKPPEGTTVTGMCSLEQERHHVNTDINPKGAKNIDNHAGDMEVVSVRRKGSSFLHKDLRRVPDDPTDTSISFQKNETITKITRRNTQNTEGMSHAIEITDNPEPEFRISKGLTTAEYEKLLALYGLNLLPEKKIPKWYIFVSQLWQPMPVMIWIAVIVEAAIQNWIDMAILLLIQFSNASIGYYETTKAGDAVEALKRSLKPKATVKRDGKWTEINAQFVVPGDLVLLASGSAIPADCRVNKGQIDVDQAALTGESLPVTMSAMDSCKMGSTVVRGETEGTVEFTGVAMSAGNAYYI